MPGMFFLCDLCERHSLAKNAKIAKASCFKYLPEDHLTRSIPYLASFAISARGILSPRTLSAPRPWEPSRTASASGTGPEQDGDTVPCLPGPEPVCVRRTGRRQTGMQRSGDLLSANRLCVDLEQAEGLLQALWQNVVGQPANHPASATQACSRNCPTS